MKKQLCLSYLLLGCMATAQGVAQTRITLTNSEEYDRTGELVEARVSASDMANIDHLALYDEAGTTVPYQALPDRNLILFQANVSAGETVTYTLKTGTPVACTTKTYAALKMPSNRNDIAWENDRAAYRMYSRVLLATEPNSANGVDLWGKKKAEPVIDKMYAYYPDYHTEKPEGVDAYSVTGKTLGAGGVAAYVGGKIWLHDPFDKCQVVTSGPLYSEFVLTYDRVEVDGDFYKKTLRISTWANGLLNKAVVKYEGRIKPMKIAVGILLHNNTAGVKYTAGSNVIGYAENKSEGTVTTAGARFYEGVYMPGTTATGVVNNQQIIYSDYAVGSEFTYYFGGGWNVFPGDCKTDNEWFAALRRFKQSISNPLLTPDSTQLPSKKDVLNAGITVNNYWIGNHADPGNNLWARSVYNIGNIDFYKVYQDQQYLNYARLWANNNKWAVSGGPSTGDADNHTCGQTYYDLYKLEGSKEPDRLKAIKAAIDYRIEHNPKSDDWWWVDAMLMAMPTIARLGVEYQDSKYFDKLHALFANTRDSLVITSRLNLYPQDYRNKYGWGPIVSGYEDVCGLYNKTDHLWWRDWGFQPGVPPKKVPGNSSADVPKHSPDGKLIYWSRGNGWVMAAMARTLQMLPSDEPHRKEYIQILKDMAAAVKNVQRADGFWNMNLADPNHYPGPETSGTALFAYAMAWGINNGLLDSTTYYPVVARAWNGLCSLAMDKSGKLSRVQNVGEGPIDPSRLNANVDFGVGVFLLAASEVAKMADGDWPEAPEVPGLLATSAAVSSNAQQVVVTFDADVDAATAAEVTNYRITGPVTPGVISATTNGKQVTLQLDKALDYGRYALEISNVKSTAGGDVGKLAHVAFVRTVPLSLTPAQREIRITAIGNQSGNPPSNVMDINLNTRWAQAGKSGQWIQFDMGKPVMVSAVDAAFYEGTKRRTFFDITASLDGKTFTPVMEDLESSGLTNQLERYAFAAPREARYIRLVCNSNSLALSGAVSEHWNSVTEVRIIYSAKTGIRQATEAGRMALSPNPLVGSRLTVALPFASTGKVSARIVSLDGRTLYDKQLAASRQKVCLDGLHLNAGQYILTVGAGGHSASQQFFVK